MIVNKWQSDNETERLGKRKEKNMSIVIKTDLETKPKKCKECPFLRVLPRANCIAGLTNAGKYRKLSGAIGFPFRRNYSNAIPDWCPLKQITYYR